MGSMDSGHESAWAKTEGGRKRKVCRTNIASPRNDDTDTCSFHRPHFVHVNFSSAYCLLARKSSTIGVKGSAVEEDSAGDEMEAGPIHIH